MISWIIPIFLTPIHSARWFHVKRFCSCYTVDEGNIAVDLCKGSQAKVSLQEVTGRVTWKSRLHILFAVVLSLNGSFLANLWDINFAVKTSFNEVAFRTRKTTLSTQISMRRDKLNSKLSSQSFNFAFRQAIIIHNINFIEVYAWSLNPIGHALQLEYLRSRNGVGSRTL